jgi:Zn-dependent oligopeptidase
MGDWTSGIFMRDDLYKVLEQYKIESDKDGSYEKLDPESKRYVNSTLTGMEETGTKLNAAQKKRYLAVQHEIHELEQKCRKNINGDKTKVMFAEAELEGIDAKQMDKLEKVKGKPGFRYIALDKK